jgi:hypothetical protein
MAHVETHQVLEHAASHCWFIEILQQSPKVCFVTLCSCQCRALAVISAVALEDIVQCSNLAIVLEDTSCLLQVKGLDYVLKSSMQYQL